MKQFSDDRQLFYWLSVDAAAAKETGDIDLGEMFVSEAGATIADEEAVDDLAQVTEPEEEEEEVAGEDNAGGTTVEEEALGGVMTVMCFPCDPGLPAHVLRREGRHVAIMLQ